MIKRIKISTDFSDKPNGREKDRYEHSGQQFREEFLEPAMRDPDVEKIEVDLDGIWGPPISFLEEAFGGLARIFGTKAVLEKVELISLEGPEIVDRVLGYIRDAKRKA